MKAWVSDLPSGVPDVSRYALKVGIKATEILFSANNRRNRFGIMNAIPNASARAVVPKKAAFVDSLTSPRILETRVSMDSRAPAASRDFLPEIFISI